APESDLRGHPSRTDERRFAWRTRDQRGGHGVLARHPDRQHRRVGCRLGLRCRYEQGAALPVITIILLALVIVGITFVLIAIARLADEVAALRQSIESGGAVAPATELAADPDPLQQHLAFVAD